jgi:hypothetical protein
MARKIDSYVEILLDPKKGTLVEFTYVIRGYGRFFRKDQMWLPFEEEPSGKYDNAESIIMDKKDARELLKKYDSGEKITREEVVSLENDPDTVEV